jgi:A/G-specific adenine glycosylase
MSILSAETKRNLVRNSIVKWFKTNGRDFPWRLTSDPYHVLIAEMLLRRTTATAVLRVYSDFMKQFKQPELLARAKITTIASMINTLGLENVRAYHLQNTALCILKKYDGSIPTALDKLVLLPGVGMYVASAVLNFAYHSPMPLVDGNVIHLMSRVFGLTFSGPTDQFAWDFMRSFDLGNQNKAFYWGIIDLVALVCFRKAPRCKICPLQELCIWTQKNTD